MTLSRRTFLRQTGVTAAGTAAVSLTGLGADPASAGALGTRAPASVGQAPDHSIAGQLIESPDTGASRQDPVGWNSEQRDILFHMQELVKAVKVLHALGYSDFAGHISYRLGPDKNLVKPRWINWRTLIERDIAFMDDRGFSEGLSESRPFREWPIHTQIYLRPGAKARCVLHLHLQHATLLASLGIPLEPLTRDLFAFNIDVPRFSNTAYLGAPDWGLITTVALGDQLAAELGSGNVILQPYHGVVIAAVEVGAAVVMAQLLERGAQAMLSAANYNRPPIIPAAIESAMTAAASIPEDNWKERWFSL